MRNVEGRAEDGHGPIGPDLDYNDRLRRLRETNPAGHAVVVTAIDEILAGGIVTCPVCGEMSTDSERFAGHWSMHREGKPSAVGECGER